MKWRYVDENRIGDHICYYSDLRKMQGALSHLGHNPSAARDLPRDRSELGGTACSQSYPLMKILITGICGFVGSALAEALLERQRGDPHLWNRQPDARRLRRRIDCDCASWAYRSFTAISDRPATSPACRRRIG